MKEMDCNVIRDLLPLYEDNMASRETQELVREHLKDCSACREELRKMRTPVSIPPDEDQDLWKKFIQRRDQLRRKRNIRIACVFSVLAAVFLFCLWYTRPQSWADVTGADAALDSGWLTMADINWNAETAAEKLGYDHWDLTTENAADAVNHLFFNLLEQYTLRASLSSLLSRDQISMGGRDTLCLVIKEGEENFRLFYFSDNGKIYTPSQYGWDVYYCDPALHDALAPLIQEYGTLQEE